MEIKKIALTIAIAVLLALFVGFLIDALYSSPHYNDFCRNEIIRQKPLEKENQTLNKEIQNKFIECQEKFKLAKEKYSRNLFFMLIPISILLISSGLLLKLESIGSGFIFGGILTAAYATIRIFGDLSKIMRVILLGIELLIIICVGYFRIEKTSRKK